MLQRNIISNTWCRAADWLTPAHFVTPSVTLLRLRAEEERGFVVQRARLAKMGQSLSMYCINLLDLLVCFFSQGVRPISLILLKLHYSNWKWKAFSSSLLHIINCHWSSVLYEKTADAAIYEAVFSLTYKPALLRQAAWIAVCLCKHVQPCVISPSIPVRPENTQRLEVMAQIRIPSLGVSLVVFTKHCTIGIQSVAFNNPTDALMAYDLYTETY